MSRPSYHPQILCRFHLVRACFTPPGSQHGWVEVEGQKWGQRWLPSPEAANGKGLLGSLGSAMA
eukprot:12740246-Heterocapsa_arctica.AAC.1